MAGIYDLYDLYTTCVLDVLGLCAQCPEAVVVKVMTRRDSRSVRVFVPNVKVVDQGFHDVMLLDMAYVDAPDISANDLSILRLQWACVSGFWDGPTLAGA